MQIRIQIQCCGSVTFWYGSGSGSADPYPKVTDLDSDPDLTLNPALIVSGFQDVDKNKFLFLSFLDFYFLKVHLNQSSKIKSHNKPQNSRNQFFLTFLLDDGRIRTNNDESGSWRPKNIRILGIRLDPDPKHCPGAWRLTEIHK
jgi:hypothetical protein